MARKLQYDKANKRTLMRENVAGNVLTRTRVCAECKRSYSTLYYYWWENDIGGINRPPRYTLPFCCIQHFRHYYSDLQTRIDANIKRELTKIVIDYHTDNGGE